MPVNTKEALVEFTGMALFVWCGVGAAVSGYSAFGVSDVIGVATGFGFGITAVAYATAHHGSGQLNPAVTWGLWLAGQKEWRQMVANWVAQCLGAILGVGVVALQSGAIDSALGCNKVNSALTQGNALVAEIMGTFLLMYVVLETAVSPMSVANPSNEAGQVHAGGMMLAPIPIGMAVLLAHLVLIPIDGCSINPARTLGSSVVSAIDGNPDAFSAHWVFWVGPLIGSTLAAVIWRYLIHDMPDVTGQFQKGDEIQMGLNSARSPKRV